MRARRLQTFALMTSTPVLPSRFHRLASVGLASSLVFTSACAVGQSADARSSSGEALSSSAPGAINGLDGKCLDDSGDGTGDGNKIQLYDCNGTDAQRWTLTDSGQITGPAGKCLDVQGDEQEPGTIVWLYTCNGTAAQVWNVVGTTLVSAGGLCLDVTGADPSNGTQLEIWTCNGQTNQSWTFGSGTSAGGGGGGGGSSSGGSGGNGGAPPPLVSPAFFVSPSGSDGNAGTTASAPFQTLEKAQQAMQAQGMAAYTTYVMGGTYARSQTLALTTYYDQNKSWLAYPGQTPVLDGGGAPVHGIDLSGTTITVSGLTLTNFQSGIYGFYADHVTVTNNVLTDMHSPDWRTNILGSSIFFLNVNTSVIEGNVVDGNTAVGIQVNGGGSGDDNSNVTVSGNTIRNTCTAVVDCGALYFRDVGHLSTGQVIANNTITDFHPNDYEESAGIYLDDETSNVTVTGNVVQGVGQYALLVHGGDHNTIRGNTFHLDQMDKLGLYQDDEGAGLPNYGMAGNVFTGNTVDSPSSSGPASVWDFIDQSSAGIAKPIDEGNTYDTPLADLPELGPIVDSAPTVN
jgi:parallel beta-helix repeat protein